MVALMALQMFMGGGDHLSSESEPPRVVLESSDSKTYIIKEASQPCKSSYQTPSPEDKM
ncbi:jg3176, partial [Pararge aegeria aegeria]